ncbi:MAG: FAD/NAD(P)-binding protein [Caldicoprobacterales bacterium]|jgi:sulfhydrogenase subunit gamma (sulfur reductase)|nr:hydrogenase [Clostridiales bacterium]
MNNSYVPVKAEIIEVIQETSSDVDIKTFKIKLVDDEKMDFLPGQFVELSIPGVGEAPFGFASSPLERNFFELSIKKTGLVTEAVHNLWAGATVWIRGPFGNSFPMEEMEGSNILLIAGGLGLAPLRPLILYMLDESNRDKYGSIQMLLAARSSRDFIYTRDFDQWKEVKNTDIILTIDNPEEGWKGRVGYPHIIVSEMEFDVNNTYAVLCGPPIMIKFVSAKLVELGFPENRIFTTLEMRMTCGVGKCGKCNIGHRYVCIDGPVFNMAQLSQMPDEY